MDVFLAGFLYLVVVKAAAALLARQVCRELDCVEAQLIRLSRLRDVAKGSVVGPNTTSKESTP